MSKRSPDKLGLLVVNHGSPRVEANREFARFGEAIAEARRDLIVEIAHMEIAQPDISTSIDVLVERGAGRVVVHLHFLAAGIHVRETIPDLLDAARARHPDLRIEAARPLGQDPRLVDFVLEGLDAQPTEDAPEKGESSKA